MISVEHASHLYGEGQTPAVSAVSLEIARGDVVAVVGPNGSGKSTLGRLMKGLLLPSSGAVTVDDHPTDSQSLETRRLVGLVFQNPDSQIVNSVVEHEVAFGPENLGLSPADIRQRVHDGLEAVGLLDRASDECHSLSMADKQRVAIASVIAMYPSYLILDEATAWLEPSARWSLLEEVLAWTARRGASLVLITHRMDEAQLCHRVYGMLDGRLEVTGTPEAVLQDEVTRSRLALDIPETLLLTRDLQLAGIPVPMSAGVERLADALCHS